MTTLKPAISQKYPMPKPPNTRVDTPSGQPPKIVPTAGVFAGSKTGLPNLPSVFQIFHRPRTAGH